MAEITALTDRELTELALTATGNSRNRAWMEILERAKPAVPKINRRGADVESFVADVHALLFEQLTKGKKPVDSICSFVFQAVNASNLQRSLVADGARRGVTGIGQRRAIAASRVAYDADVLGSSAATVWEQEGAARPNADGLSIAEARGIAVLGNPTSIDALFEANTAGDFEPALTPLNGDPAPTVREFSPAEKTVLKAFEALTDAEREVLAHRHGLTGGIPVEGTAALAEVTGMSPREVKTRLQSAKRKLTRVAMAA